MKKYILRHKAGLLLSIAFGVLSTILWVNFANIMGNLVDSTVAYSKTQFIQLMIYVIFYILFVRFINGLSSIIKSNFINNTMKDLKTDYLDYIYRLKTVDCQGNIISKFNNDMNTIKTDYLDNLIYMISGIISIILSSYYLIRLNVIITVVLYALIIVILLLPYVCREVIEKFQKKVSEGHQDITERLQDDLSGLEVIRNYEASKSFFKISIAKTNLLTKLQIKSESINIFIEEISHYFITLIGAVGFILGSYYVLKGTLSYGNMVSIVQLSNTLVSPVSEIVRSFTLVIAGKTLVNQLVSEMNDSNKVVNLEYLKNFESIDRITFDHVSLTIDHHQIIQDFSYEFKKGKRYLIIGKSGAGKSTLLKLITKKYSNYTGNIYINDTEIRRIDEGSISRIIGYMNQNPYIFNLSIKDNIQLYRDIDYTAVIEKVGLKTVIDHLPLGINDNCNKLSGGEKERVALCRLILDSRSICLLDEVTASLDHNIAKEIDNIIVSIPCDILITVAHHIDPDIKDQYDYIIDLDV